MTFRRVLLMVVAVALATGPVAAAPVLKAQAGLDGACRAGRWAPVRVQVEATSENIDGQLILQWGGARVVREIALTAPSRHTFELYVRAVDARGSIEVTLRASGREPQAVVVPVRLIKDDSPTVLCVQSDERTDGGADCGISAPASSLPRSWRGYDAVDEVRLPAGIDAGLSADQRRALAQWTAFRTVEAPGNVAPGVPDHPANGGRVVLAGMVAGYMLLFVAATAAHGKFRLPTAAYWVACALTIVVGSGAALYAGRFGPASGITVRHESVIQQFPAVGASLVSMRGRALFPSDGDFTLRAGVSDGVIESRTGPADVVEHRYDAAGFPLFSGSFGLGAVRSFDFEAVGGFSLLAVTQTDRTTHLQNVSRFDLLDCEGFGVSPAARLGRLSAGTGVDVEVIDGEAAPRVSCIVNALPIDFWEPRVRVVSTGRVRVICHLAPSNAERARP